MFNIEEERTKVYHMLVSQSEEEKAFSKQEIIKKSVNLALEEIEEFEKAYQDFVERVQHLCIFQQQIFDPLDKDIKKVTNALRTIIKKNYTAEELENLSGSQYNKIVRQQKERVDLLKKIAKTYLSHTKQQ